VLEEPATLNQLNHHKKPTYEKFEDDEHAEQFEKIKGFKFTGERKFDFINL
jgi:hypothetical protein